MTNTTEVYCQWCGRLCYVSRAQFEETRDDYYACSDECMRDWLCSDVEDDDKIWLAENGL